VKVNTAAIRAGFTLLELLTVMGIMLLLMGAAFGAFHGFMRGASIRSATMNLRSTLSLARQYAVTRRCKTHVLFWQDSTNANYVICMEDGQQVKSGGILWTDPPKWGNLCGAEIYNLTSEEMGIVASNNAADSLTATNAAHPSLSSPMTWAAGDRYGWALRHQTHLPEGVSFTNGAMAGGAPSKVSFNSDGTAPMVGPGYYSVQFVERATAAAAIKEIRVQGLTGQIKVMP